MIETVIDIAKGAGKILMKYYKKEIQITNKSTSDDFFDPVTTADFEAEKYITKRLLEVFPDDEILGEETNAKVDFSGRVWIIDPLDGTRQFINQSDNFSVHIGLCDNGVPVLGVIYNPVPKECYYAEKGKGSFLEKNGETIRIHVSKQDDITKSKLLRSPVIGDSEEFFKTLERLPGKHTLVPSGLGYKIGFLARGECDLHTSSWYNSKWDFCAPQIVLEEAGGKLTDIDGESFDYKQKSSEYKRFTAASNGILHEAFLNEFSKIK